MANGMRGSFTVMFGLLGAACEPGGADRESADVIATTGSEATTASTTAGSTSGGGGMAAGTAASTSASTSGSAGGAGGSGGGPALGADAWTSGALPTPLPTKGALLALPGVGVGAPVFTSNNPEVFEGNGLLYGTGKVSPTRGGDVFPLSGDFGVYFHHLNKSNATKIVTLMVTNPNASAITVSAEGSGYSQTETGGLGLGTSPDYVVSDEWIRGDYDTIVPPTNLPPNKPMAVWQKPVNHGAEIDGRFVVHTSGPAYAYLVATDGTDLNQAIAVYQTHAPGYIAVSGNPPPPFGREAGVYAHDTWEGTIDIAVPPADHHVGFAVNTATGLAGGSFPDVQAFPALTHYNDSAAEAVGMYGNVYDVVVRAHHDGSDGAERRVSVVFASLSGDLSLSRFWDGVGLVDGQPVVLQHTPANRKSLVAELTLAPGEVQEVRFQAMVPGLTSIPQALYLVSH
jgi:hypothetical protein